MNAAIALEMFTAIAEGNTTSAMIAKRCKAAEAACASCAIRSRFSSIPRPAFAGICRQGYRVSACAAVARMSRAAARRRSGGTALGEGALAAENPNSVKFATP